MRLLGSVVAMVVVLGLGGIQARAQDPNAWVGKRVVTKFGTVLMTGQQGAGDPKRVVQPGVSERGDFRVYRVERVNGPWLWLVAEIDGTRGWIPAEHVVLFDRANEYYASVVRANPADSRAYIGRGKSWHAKGEYDKAVADYDQAIRLAPKDARAYLARGDAWLEKGQFSRALADADEAIHLEPREAQGYVARGKAGKSKRASDKASADASAAIAFVPSEAPAPAPRAVVPEPLKPGAAPVVPGPENGSPDGPRSPGQGQSRLSGADQYNGRGESWHEKREYDKAIDDYSEAIRLDPTFATAYNNRGLAWLDKRGYDQALTDFNEALQLNPGHPAAFNNRGLAWYEKREYDKALADFDEAIRLRPSLGTAYGNRGLTWFAKRKFEKARADFNEVLRFDDKDALAHNNCAWLWAACPDPKFRDGKRAVESANHACTLSGWKEANYVGTLAAAYAEAGDFEAAIKWQTKAQGLYVHKKEQIEGEERLSLYRARKPYHVVLDEK